MYSAHILCSNRLASLTSKIAMEETMAFSYYSLLLAIVTVTAISVLLRLLKPKPPPAAAALPPSPASLPIIGHLHLLSLPLHHTLSRLSHRHGPVFLLRLGPRPVLVVSSPAAAADCLVKNGVPFANRPRLSSLNDLTYNFTSFGTAPYGPDWLLHRRAAQGALFSPARQHSIFTTVIQEEIKQWVRRLVRSGNKDCFEKLSVLGMMSEITTSVILKTLTGKRFMDEHGEDTEEGRKCRYILDEFFYVVSAASIDGILPFLKWLRFRGNKDRRRLRVLEREMDEFFSKLLEGRRRERTDGAKMTKEGDATMIDLLLSMQESTETEFTETYSDLHIKGMLQSILVGGSVTAGEALEWAMALLLTHPQALEKARLEILANVGQNRLLNDSDLPNLPYTKNIIKETLRLFPTGPLLVPHESSKECTVGGFHIPSGTLLAVNVYAIQRDPKVWAEPSKFKPERFEHHDDAKDLEKVYFPFGIGRRSCPGDGMAVPMMSLALGSLIQCFEWERIGEEKVDMSEGSGINMQMAKPLVAKYKPREDMLHVLSRL